MNLKGQNEYPKKKATRTSKRRWSGKYLAGYVEGLRKAHEVALGCLPLPGGSLATRERWEAIPIGAIEIEIKIAEAELRRL